MVGRFAALILVTACLLLPGILSAEDRPPAGTDAEEPLEIAQAEAAQVRAGGGEDPKVVDPQELEQLTRRVEQLEIERAAHEDATRFLIRDAISTLGAKINEFVTLGGTLEVIAGTGQDFGQRQGAVLTRQESASEIRLNTAELDLEIQVNEWTLGSIIVEYDDGGSVLFPTGDGFETFIDRINLDVAFVTIGNPMKFPPFLTAGRMILPFGISTGDPVADVLTLDDPLTIEVFEMREVGFGLGFGFPTPKLGPPPLPVTPPAVKPRVIRPLISSLARRLGYKPPPRPPAQPAPLIPTPNPPLFNAGVYFFDGDTFQFRDGGWNPANQLGATVGFRTKGHCGHPYEHDGREWRTWRTITCPWSIDVDVDFNSSVFDSRFLDSEAGYRAFLGQIGFVPGMSASLKTTLGPMSIVGEWNGALNSAKFVDDLGQRWAIRPSTWQISVGYQFDWNPWVEVIGAQGSYMAISYSESQGLEGVTRLIAGQPIRRGFVPRRRFLVSAGEWVLDGVRFAVEYSRIWDYPFHPSDPSSLGTGRAANGFFAMLTYVW